jgi:hypothetical protein
MNDHSSPQPSEIAELMHDHGQRWQIEHDPAMGVWTAVHRSPDGRHIRMLVARTPAALGTKLADADSEERPA